MIKSGSLSVFPREQRPSSRRLDLVAEGLSYLIQYIAADDLYNWAAADICACGEVAANDLAELETVIEAAFHPVRRHKPDSVGMRFSTVPQ